MDVQLNDLLEKIQKDGAAKANAEAERIRTEAENQARAVVAQAQSDAEEIVASARFEAERLVSAGNDALRQSGRDLLLTVEGRLVRLFREVTRASVDQALSPQVVAKLAQTLVEAWGTQGEKGIEVTLASADADAVGDELRRVLANKVASGVTIVASDRLAKGFRVQGAGSSLTLDLSSEALAELLADSLQPSLAKLLREAAR